MVANKPVEVALSEIVTRARVFTDAGGAAIALREGNEAVTRASSGNIAPDVGTRMNVEGSLTGQALLKGAPVHVEDSDSDPRVDAATCRAMNTRSFIITPIAGSTSTLGVLAVFASAPNAFTRTDLAVLRTMADQISSALGGGSFLQQSWPESKAGEPEPEVPEGAVALETSGELERAEPVLQAAQVRPVVAEPAPDKPSTVRVIVPPVAPVSPVKDVQFKSPDESDAVAIEPAPPVAPTVRTIELPPATSTAPTATSPLKPKEGLNGAPKAKSGPVASVPSLPQTNESSRAEAKDRTAKGGTKLEEQAVAVPAKDCFPSPSGAAEPELVSLAEVIDQPAKPVRAIKPNTPGTAPLKPKEGLNGAPKAPKDRQQTELTERQIAWAGLTAGVEPEQRPVGRIVMVADGTRADRCRDCRGNRSAQALTHGGIGTHALRTNGTEVNASGAAQ